MREEVSRALTERSGQETLGLEITLHMPLFFD